MTGAETDPPLIRLTGVGRAYALGGVTVTALDGIDLTIRRGEMVAIVGASGSGRSTLLNILGCLDVPDTGAYAFLGRDVGGLDPDALAKMRRDHIGFVFQQYNLLPDLTALANVELPALYAGRERAARRRRALALLDRLGLAARAAHRPGELSGGQQQRVAIARALVNDAELVLADEPTGALDSRTGEEMLDLLRALHRDGRTVVIVTHDMGVARHAGRIVEIRDGRIVADHSHAEAAAATVSPATPEPPPGRPLGAALDAAAAAIGIALRSMAAHRLRTMLTILGVVIGIASVVLMVALGEGGRQRVLADFASLGTDTLTIMPGSRLGDPRAAAIDTLVAADADALAEHAFVADVTPEVTSGTLLRHGNVAAEATVAGVGEAYFQAYGMALAAGAGFDREAVRAAAQEVVIDGNTRKTLFPDLAADPLGEVILIGDMPARVVGVVDRQRSFVDSGRGLRVYLPHTTVSHRILGTTSLRAIIVRVADGVPTTAAAAALSRLLEARHGAKDFFILDSDEFRQRALRSTETFNLLIGGIGALSLFVSGIGVMNIMLVTVAERTREIGVRMAVGARRSDILAQILIEAVLVCLVGGTFGLALALTVGLGFPAWFSGFPLALSTDSVIVAVLFSTAVGVLSGFFPARRAARLDPARALVRE